MTTQVEYLYLKIHRAINLEEKHHFRHTNPYVIVEYDGEICRSAVFRNDLNPNFEEEFCFQVSDGNSSIVVKMLDSHTTGDYSLGALTISCDQLDELIENGEEQSFTLHGCKSGAVIMSAHIEIKEEATSSSTFSKLIEGICSTASSVIRKREPWPSSSTVPSLSFREQRTESRLKHRSSTLPAKHNDLDSTCQLYKSSSIAPPFKIPDVDHWIFDLEDNEPCITILFDSIESEIWRKIVVNVQDPWFPFKSNVDDPKRTYKLKAPRPSVNAGPYLLTIRYEEREIKNLSFEPPLMLQNEPENIAETILAPPSRNTSVSTSTCGSYYYGETPSTDENLGIETMNLMDQCSKTFQDLVVDTVGSSLGKKNWKVSWNVVLGRGATGVVYQGMNLKTGKLVAMKCLGVDRSLQESVAESLLAEVSLLKQLQHPNLVCYYDCYLEDSILWMVVEYAAGGSLDSVIGKFGSLTISVIKRYAKHTCLGLEYLHEQKIVHRDIKPANLLLDSEGNCKLSDFGAARHVSSLCQPTWTGTPLYMSPEAIHGHPEFASDIWSLGLTLLQMHTAKPPWNHLPERHPAQVLLHITQKNQHPFPDDIPDDLKEMISDCIKQEPSERPTASDLLQYNFLTEEDI